jgi:hypothetical protein
MNVPFLLFYIITIIILFIFILISSLSLYNWIKYDKINNVPFEDCSKPSFETLIDISKLKCCVIGGYITSKRYISSIDMVVDNVATPYLKVCKEFCSNEVIIENNKIKCVDPNKQVDFDSCVELLNNDKCKKIVAMPIAHNGITYFYAFSATDSICKKTEEC